MRWESDFFIKSRVSSSFFVVSVCAYKAEHNAQSANMAIIFLNMTFIGFNTSCF